MGLETGNFISDLVSSNPVGATDTKAQGDDHLRLIKSVLQATFPNASRAFRFEVAGAAKTANYTIVAADQRALITFDATSGDLTAAITAISNLFAGWLVTVMKTDSSANTVTVDPNGAETVNGAATYVLADQYDFVTIMVQGSEFKILGTGKPVTSLTKSVAFTGVISPTQLTADVNNYNPTGLASASTLRLSADDDRSITGLAGGAAGRVVILHNVGANDITLVDESASSTAANRFALAENLVLAQDTMLVLQYDATSSRWRTGRVPPRKDQTLQIITVDGTWTKPKYCRRARVRVVGGGGGGGNASASSECGTGGGSGGYAEKLLDVTAISSSTITIGAGGAASAAGAASSWADGTNTITGNGGSAGADNLTEFSASSGASGGSASGGDINITGGGGGGGMVANGRASGGHGGSNPLGQGGAQVFRGGNGAQNGNSGTGYGAGGSGGARVNSGTGTGGAGTDGVVIVEEFY